MNKKATQFFNLLMLCLFFVSSVSAQSQNGSISGTIKTSDGKPAGYVNVGLKNTNKLTQTNEDGSFTIKNIKPGTYTLKISATGATAQEKTITVNAGQISDADFSIAESSSQLDEVNINGYKSSNLKPTTVGKIAIAPKDLPQAVQIIGRQVIEDQQVNRLSDVLKNVNGVAYGENRGGVSGETFFARGYSLGGNNVFKNGARTSTGGMPETSTLESVEVLKGSAALLYGGVSGGAVVNMVTKKPKFEYGGEVSMRTGSYDLYKPTLDLYGPISKKLAFRVIGTYETAGSYRNSVDAKRTYVNPSLLYKISENTDITLQGDYLKSNYTPDFGIGTIDNKIVDIGRKAYLNAPWAYNNTNTVTSQLNLNHKINNNWKLNVIAALQSYDRNYFSAERPFANAAGIAARNVTRAKTREYTYNQQINVNGSFKTGTIEHALLIGADADQSRTTSNGFLFGAGEGTGAFNYGNVNLLDPSTYAGSGIEPNTINVTRTYAPIYRVGTFVQDLISVTEQFKVLAGIRYTFQKTPKTSIDSLQKNKTITGTTAGKTDQAFTPKFALIYQPLKTTSVYVSYATNFLPNTGINVETNSLMGPSIVDQYEAGVKNDFLDGRLSANVTAYRIKNDNLAQTAVLNTLGQPNSDTNIKEFSGATTSDGVEIDLTGNLARGLNFLAGYSYNYYRFTSTDAKGIVEGERVVGSTKNTANATLFYTIQNGVIRGLKLGASAYYTGDRNGGYNTKKDGSQRGPVLALGDFTTIDLSAGYSWKKLSLLAKLSNITDELNYFVHENYSVNPIPPRQFITTLSYKF